MGLTIWCRGVHFQARIQVIHYLQRQFGSGWVKLHITITYSGYTHEVREIYEAMQRDCHRIFDTSVYLLNNRYSILINKKIIGMMKVENNGVITTDLIGLRWNLYKLKLLINGDEVEKLSVNFKKKNTTKS